MSKSVSLVAAAAAFAVAGLAPPALAYTFTPNSPTAITYVTLTGNLVITQATPVSCAVTLRLAISPGGAMAYIDSGMIAPGDWQCGFLVSPTGFPWTFIPLGSQIQIGGVSLSTILGSCSGTIFANWGLGPPGQLQLNNAISGSPAQCSIVGTLVSSPSLSY